MKAFWLPPWRRVHGQTPSTSEMVSLIRQPDPQSRFKWTYQAQCAAPVETLWQLLIDLADVSWHPLIGSTDVPHGLTAKPGLIYRAMPRWFPVPIQIFVERVTHQKLLSVRLFPVPGLEERVVCQLESTVWGTQISYSVTLRGWLSPIAGSILHPWAVKILSAIALAAEKATAKALPPTSPNSVAQ